MLKLLHLFNNRKFVDDHISRFEDSEINNCYVYLDEDNPYEGKYLSKVSQLAPFSPGFMSLIKDAHQFDIVFVYHLDYPKSYFVNRIQRDVLVIWYFYGTEIYNELAAFRFHVYSKATRKLLGENLFSDHWKRTRRLGSWFKHLLGGKLPTFREVTLAMQRVNYFTTFSKEEYAFIKRKGGNLIPAFLSLPLYDAVPGPSLSFSNNRKTFLLGHSASSDGNHADIIELLTKYQYQGTVVVPLSYGENERYKEQIVRLLASTKLKVQILDTFLPPLAYQRIIRQCGTAVFNSYRQLAVGNILMALKNGVKVYLNERNPSYEWLCNAGFAIFSIQLHLTQDLHLGSTSLTEQEAVANAKLYTELTDPAHNQLYLRQLHSLAEKHGRTLR